MMLIVIHNGFETYWILEEIGLKGFSINATHFTYDDGNINLLFIVQFYHYIL